MRYMMLVYTQETANRTPEEMQAVQSGHWAVMDETSRRGILVDASPLARTSSATSVRMENGKAMVTDGPFAETKEQLAGYYILECADLDEAIAWASKIPSACGGASGCIEVRPVQEMSRVPESFHRSRAAFAQTMNG
ncbi:MAG TPA: YciI family protein [Candidatus Binatia bacterium]|nr:YciI family protein [Candidatus Binatia bacterium]